MAGSLIQSNYFVVSRKTFNKHTKMAIVAPVTSTIRGIKLEVVLSQATQTKGAVLVHQLKSIDFVERNAVFIEKVPANIVETVLSIARLLVR